MNVLRLSIERAQQLLYVEIQKRPMLSPHTTEWHPKETTLCDSDTAFQSNTHVHHNIQFTCTNNVSCISLQSRNGA
jgi:hypothetical protein